MINVRGRLSSFKFLFAFLLITQPAFAQIEQEADAIEAEAASIPETPLVEPEPVPAPPPPKPTKKELRQERRQKIKKQAEEFNQGVLDATGKMIASSRDMVSDRVILLANKVDGLFGNSRALDEYYKSSLKISTGTQYNANNGTYDNSFSTSLILSLPNLKERERAFNDFWNRKPDQPPTAALEDDLISKEEFKEQNPWDFATEAGVRWKWPPAYFGKLRLAKSYLTEDWVDYWQNELGWDSETLWASKSSVTSDYAFSRYFLFRFLNEANWYMSEPSVFSTTHGPSWIYSFEDKSLVSFDLRFSTRSIQLEMYGDIYGVGMTYRTGFKKVKWIFIEIAPLCQWKLDDGFTPSTSINVKLDFLIGREKTSTPKSTNPLDIL
ncbi:hypothetical protein [Bdellovibrio sp. HCB209]|uniref:hypothetical protein n=1 Tax=Bdellovibrio sp. HCB209 TaxID=3394354 RepID=UPI0039B6478D